MGTLGFRSASLSCCRGALSRTRACTLEGWLVHLYTFSVPRPRDTVSAGVVASCARSLVPSVLTLLLRFFFSSPLSRQIVGGGEELTIPQYYAAGSLASIPISVVEAPVDLFKIKLQAQVNWRAWCLLGVLPACRPAGLPACLCFCFVSSGCHERPSPPVWSFGGPSHSRCPGCLPALLSAFLL